MSTSTSTRTPAARAAGAARRAPRGGAASTPARSARGGVRLGRPTRGGGRPGRGPGGVLPTGRAATVVLCGAVLVVALLLALWINIALSRGSYEQHALEAERTQLTEQQQALDEHLAEVSSASALDARARAMGMVRAPDSAWLVLEAPQEQAVVGDPEAATTPTPSATPSGAPSSASSGSAEDEADDEAAGRASDGPSASDAPSASGSASPSSSASGTPSSQPSSRPTSSAGGAG
ncbi:hypothetical protein [Quadrisphaera sp. INWT6]|uniref:hypothetical protein n=1 Tax=Quadrisphaera sp. INWT6 TaxID=2596917 RepID=UPI00189254DD|nr:hypothetical protein [Quadrisphaera sp. INWT6]MBF5080828.1 hypothetical protein [Quadrisphaera sp. INWT6]